MPEKRLKLDVNRKQKLCPLEWLKLVTGADNILDDYERCKSDLDFGVSQKTLCDPDDSLRAATKEQLTGLLAQLQSKVSCNCENGCYRGANLTDEFTGLLLVTNSSKIEASGQPLAKTAQHIYEDALLGNETCDNGLLIVYVEDQQKLATYRGVGNFLLLTDQDMERLQGVAVQHGVAPTNAAAALKDEATLRYFLTNYDALVERAEVHHPSSWTPYVGLWIALVLILLILAVLLACLCARFCCCCCGAGRRSKKDKYVVTPVSTYKPTPEPLYIVTPPPPPHILHHEAIYSSPYPGSPPPPLGSSSSRPITPNSTHRTKIYSVTSGTSSTTAPMSPIPRSSSSAAGKQIQLRTTGPLGASPPKSPNSPNGPKPATPDSSDVSIDLPYLDPNRARETQTRQDYIL
uniref:TPM_phosphatase domain-containing protein n=1 Tax=Panagrellus redivivus TaxID=6233 RepID=A0A7E4VYX1_PANRE